MHKQVLNIEIRGYLAAKVIMATAIIWMTTWGFAASSAVSPQDEITILAQNIRKEYQHCKDVVSSSQGERLIVFVGSTGAGKSTLVNYIAGNNLKPTEDGMDFELGTNRGKVLPIGNGGNSETMRPQYIDMGRDEEKLFRLLDFPGLFDTRPATGAVNARDVLNAALFKRIIEGASSVTFALVLEEPQLLAVRSQPAQDVIARFKNFFPKEKWEEILGNSVLFITKVSVVHPKWTSYFNPREYYKKKISAIDSKLDQDFSFWKGADRAVLFFRPGGDSITPEEMREVIESTRGCKVPSVTVDSLLTTDLKGKLQGVFQAGIQAIVDEQLKVTYKKLSDIAAVDISSNDAFLTSIIRRDGTMEVVKNIYSVVYDAALTAVKTQRQSNIAEHISGADRTRSQIWQRIINATREHLDRAMVKHASKLLPQLRQSEGQFLEFAAYKPIYDEVCSTSVMATLANDDLEKDFVRRVCTLYILTSRLNKINELVGAPTSDPRVGQCLNDFKIILGRG